jgi:hypothetical protein
MLAAFAALRIVAVAGLEPVSYPDTSSYLRIDFPGEHSRLWTVPVVYKVLATDGLRVAGQVAIGIACWSGLAIAAARACSDRLVAVCAAMAILLVGLTVQVTQWDRVLLSESLTLSLTVLGAALGLLAAEGRPGRALVVALVSVVLLWTFARQVNALAPAALLPVVAGLALWRLRRRQAVVLVACLTLVAAWGLLAAWRSGLWKANGQVLLVERLLQDPATTSYFAERGLPVTPRLRREVRLRRRLPDFPEIDSVTEAPRFRRWMNEEWPSAHASYLLRNAPETVAEPLRRAPRELADDKRYSKPRAVLPDPVQGVIWNRSRNPLGFLLLAGCAIGVWLVSLRRGPPRAAEIVPWALIAIAVAGMELSWNSTATEIPRLFLPSGVCLAIGFLLLAALAIDRLLTGREPEGYPLRASPDSSAG